MTASILLRSRRDRVARDARAIASVHPSWRPLYRARIDIMRTAARLMRKERPFPRFMARLGFAEYTR